MSAKGISLKVQLKWGSNGWILAMTKELKLSEMLGNYLERGKLTTGFMLSLGLDTMMSNKLFKILDCKTM